MKKLLATIGAVLVCATTPAPAHHANPMCALPEEVLDDVAPKIPVELRLVKLDRVDMLAYVAAMFKLTGGGNPPFDLSKVASGVVIYSPNWPNVYVGVVDGDGGVICHATLIPLSLHKAVLTEVEKGKA